MIINETFSISTEKVHFQYPPKKSTFSILYIDFIIYDGNKVKREKEVTIVTELGICLRRGTNKIIISK